MYSKLIYINLHTMSYIGVLFMIKKRIRKNLQITEEMQERISWVQQKGNYLNESEVLRMAISIGLPDLEARVNFGKEEK